MAPARTTPGVLRNVGLSCAALRTPLPALPVSPPLSQTGHFPNFSLLLTRLRFSIASWGTHSASKPRAQGSSTQRRSNGRKVSVRDRGPSTAGIVKLSMPLIVSIVSEGMIPPLCAQGKAEGEKRGKKV